MLIFFSSNVTINFVALLTSRKLPNFSFDEVWQASSELYHLVMSSPNLHLGRKIEGVRKSFLIMRILCLWLKESPTRSPQTCPMNRNYVSKLSPTRLDRRWQKIHQFKFLPFLVLCLMNSPDSISLICKIKWERKNSPRSGLSQSHFAAECFLRKHSRDVKATCVWQRSAWKSHHNTVFQLNIAWNLTRICYFRRFVSDTSRVTSCVFPVLHFRKLMQGFTSNLITSGSNLSEIFRSINHANSGRRGWSA